MNDTFEDYIEDIESLLKDVEEKTFTEASLNKKDKKDLVAECAKYNLATSGTKKELVSRLLEYGGDIVVVEAKSKVKIVKVEGATGDRV